MKRWISGLLGVILLLGIMPVLHGGFVFFASANAASNEAIIYNYFKNTIKLNTAAACGALANIEKESAGTFSPTIEEFVTGIGYGICQWSYSRRTELKQWCNDNGYGYDTLEGQLNFLYHELQTSEKTTLNKLRSVSDTSQGAYDAGYYWCYYFERPAYKENQSVLRGNLARSKYWSKYSGEWPTYPAYPGGINSDVYWIQRALIDLNYDCGSSGADGVMGQNTANAIRKFQGDNGLAIDGQVGKDTWNMLLTKLHEKYDSKPDGYQPNTTPPNPEAWPQYPDYPNHLFKKTDSSVKTYDWNVWWAQNALQDLDYDCGWSGADGKFGNDTTNAVKRFQADNGLENDGIIGTDTWHRLIEKLREKYPPVVKPGAASLSINDNRIPLNGTVTFTAASDTATEYCLGIFRDEARIETTPAQSGANFTYTCTQAGLYSAYVTASNAAGGIDSGWVYWQVVPSEPVKVAEKTANGHTYAMYLSDKDWKDAKGWCEKHGGYLVTITDQSEQDVLTSLLGNHKNGSYWFGAENERTGNYAWVTCEAFQYTNWGPGEPNNEFETEHYLGTYHSEKWNDFPYNTNYICGFVMETGTVPDSKKAHTWDSGTVTTAATCTKKGVKTYTCVICGNKKTEEIPLLAHQLVKTAARPASCTKPGNIEYYTCSVCKKMFSDAKGTKIISDPSIPVVPHQWDGGTVTTPPTASAEGVMTYRCTVCGTEKTETIPKLDYLPGDINGDNKTNNKDLVRLMKYLAGEDVEVVADALDVNGDDKTNNKDLVRLMKYLAGEDVEIN